MSAVLSAANRHDMKMLQEALHRPVIRRPRPTPPQHLCLDTGSDSPECRHWVPRRGDLDHIPHRGEAVESQPRQRHPARRWVVERTTRWHHLYRRLTIRYEVPARTYLGFVEFASAIICFRACHAGQ